MKPTIAQRIKVFIIRTSLELVVLVDFMADAPTRIFKYAMKIFAYASFISLFFGLIIIESEQHYAQNVLRQLIISRHRSLAFSPRPDIPRKVKDVEFPQISARSYIIVDLKTKTILEEYNSKTPLPPASTTKLMTAIISREIYNLDEVLEVPFECSILDTSQVGYEAGEKISVKDLISSLLISSAGDSACTLARRSPDFTYDQFISKMNTKALESGMSSTNFTNPEGVDDFDANHLVSAYDLYLLSMLARKDPFIKSVVATKEYDIVSGNVKRKIFNTNDLLWDRPGTVGIKTGTTYGAGEVLIYEYNLDNKDILIVIMGSLDRFSDTESILDWTLESYSF